MARCEDWPCCGHEDGCCPDYDESGRQINMVCTCGKKLSVDNHSSICDDCLRGDDYDDCGDYDRSVFKNCLICGDDFEVENCETVCQSCLTVCCDCPEKTKDCDDLNERSQCDRLWRIINGVK